MSDEPFVVDTIEKAAWAMRKYREAAQRKARNEALAEAEYERIREWLESANRKHDDAMAFFAGHLEGFARAERAEGRKSVPLPDGTVKTRAKGPSFEIDKPVFLEWAQEHKPDVLKVSYTPSVTAMKDLLAVAGATVVDPDTGETVPGVYATPEDVGITISPDLDAADLGGDDDSDE